MYNPVSTYRIQFNKDYTFNDFRENLEYFRLLGPSTIYASPVFEAVPGSMHGYDVTDPRKINPEIGTYDDFKDISDALKKAGTGWIQDIVPNHMAYHMNNSWLMDVLEKGPQSRFSSYFDIDFAHPRFNEKLTAPFLGKTLPEVLKSREIEIDWLNGNFIFRYSDFWFPFSFESFRTLLLKYLDDAPGNVRKICQRIDLFKPEFPDEELNEIRDYFKNKYKRFSFENYIKTVLNSVNHNSDSFNELLDLQHYELCYWGDAEQVINYRRFFTVNGLICLNMENDDVFNNYHSFIKQQVTEKRFDGLRIDHIDGLKEPVRYLENLRVLTDDEIYIIAEKILEKDEELLTELPIQGTSGYDFMSMINNLFTFGKNIPVLNRFYRKQTGFYDEPEDIIYRKKKFILTQKMHGEWDNLLRLFFESEFLTGDEQIPDDLLKEAIAEFLANFPVYKLYSDYIPLPAEDANIINDVLKKAMIRNQGLTNALNILGDIFLMRSGFDEGKKEAALRLFQRCMQFTGPLMAKGVEDTAMYFYNSFICHNEVGDNPSSTGISVKNFHAKMLKRQKNWPLSMSATSTHDTKRGEDVRARLNIISEIPGEWMAAVKHWMKINKRFKTDVNGVISPSVNEEYFIYQTLAGTFPFNGITGNDYFERIKEYLIKSLREAKTNTNWKEPNKEHEQQVIEFTQKILDRGNEFLKTFTPLQNKISEYGIINSLDQLVLKSTCPGIPDFYQGTELWDLSMVDPDNRRPVDYTLRHILLKDILSQKEKGSEKLFNDLFVTRIDGRIKLFMTHILMNERRSDPELFTKGRYQPLDVSGRYKGNIIAFARIYKERWYIIVVPLFLSLISENNIINKSGRIDWQDTTVFLPSGSPVWWQSPFSEKEFYLKETIKVNDIMDFSCPVVLRGQAEKHSRAAGILAHVTSLPGRYGTGDLGNEAFQFIDFLRDSGQSYWQILPLNPIGKNYSYSPYSSASAFAGNIMLLSPDLLMNSHLISEKNLNQMRFRESDRTHYKRAMELRSYLLEKAYQRFKELKRPFLEKKFKDFCSAEKYWLDDYSTYVMIKQEMGGKPWNKWPEKLKNRDLPEINEFVKKNKQEIEREKFGQFLFREQWQAVKTYANNNGIMIIGDMSFYVNYDSSELWSHPEYFKLDPKLHPSVVAGVPPDYFSKTGQLWNMPVYDWKAMKDNNYDWWIKRISKNLEFCDIVRFDHFRGFSEYWEVPAGETTAINGKWMKGPGSDFFENVKKHFPEMPFIAEDLGTIDDKVIKLRNDFFLPGMLVLQFAFGDNTPRSLYIPHNHTYNNIVYTGTHDNNTIKGWYSKELSIMNREEASAYVGHTIFNNTSNIDFIRMAYGSVARIAIIPIQDHLGLEEDSRLNYPSTIEGNWLWKLQHYDIKPELAENIRKMVDLFGR